MLPAAAEFKCCCTEWSIKFMSSADYEKGQKFARMFGISQIDFLSFSRPTEETDFMDHSINYLMVRKRSSLFLVEQIINDRVSK